MKEETLIKQCIYDSCTDLQEINKLISYFENLQKENIQLKIQLLEKKCSDKDIEYKEKIKLQQKIDKAIEYIEHEKFGDKYGNFVIAIGENNGCPEEACEELLKILKGKSE